LFVVNKSSFILTVNPNMSSKLPVSSSLQAGAAQVDISPETSQFLWGYPHVARMSTGIHDPIFA